MGSGGGTCLPFAAPSEVFGKRLSGAGGGGKERSTQGLKLQLLRAAVINQELKLRISPGVPELLM